MKCKICGSLLINKHDKICSSCDALLATVVKTLKSTTDKVFLTFVLSNRKWLAKIIAKCKNDWHGSVTISVKGGVLTHAKFMETDLIA